MNTTSTNLTVDQLMWGTMYRVSIVAISIFGRGVESADNVSTLSSEYMWCTSVGSVVLCDTDTLCAW